MGCSVGDRKFGVIGARSIVGESLLEQLIVGGHWVQAFTRRVPAPARVGAAPIEWLPLPATEDIAKGQAPLVPRSSSTSDWLCAAPIWVLPPYLPLLEATGAQRLVAISSTSRWAKEDSADLSEQALARRLAEAEEAVREWSERRGIPSVILRPTLIYGGGRDRNITEIVRFIRLAGFFPVLGPANGLRQPIRASEVARACLVALQTCRSGTGPRFRTYDIGGGEALSYRNMVTRVFDAMGRPVRLPSVPRSVFQVALALFRLNPRLRHWNIAMVERMNKDLVFDNSSAERELGFRSDPFRLEPGDVAA